MSRNGMIFSTVLLWALVLLNVAVGVYGLTTGGPVWGVNFVVAIFVGWQASTIPKSYRRHQASMLKIREAQEELDRIIARNAKLHAR